jgi:hypothetical protein
MVLAAIALTLASLGTLAWHRLTPTVADNTANLGGLSVEVASAELITMGHVHNGQGGFLMPHQMMPDAPQNGEVRLGIGITLSNLDSRTQAFDLLEEFSVIDIAGAPRALRADSIGTLPRLAPGTAVRGTLYFDVPETTPVDRPVVLRWVRAGHTADIVVPFDSPTAGHDHG